MYFLRNIIFHFPSVKKVSYFREKESHLSSWYKEDHIPVQFFWKDHLFGTFEEYIIFPCIFFKKDHLSFSASRIISYFRGKEISSFLMIQERSYSSAILWKDHLFRTFGKRNYGFSCSAFFKSQVSFSSNFASLFNVMKSNSSVLF